MAKNEFRFLNSRQLWANTQAGPSSSCDRPSMHWCVAAGGGVATHCAAILMNFLRSCTLLLSWLHRQTSVTTHSWTWLNRRRNRSRLAVVLLKFCRPKVWYSSSCWGEKRRRDYRRRWIVQRLLLRNDPSLIFLMLMFSLGGCATSCMQLKSSQSNMVIW